MKRRRPSLPGPGYDGRFEPGVMEVQDPYDAKAKLRVVVNVRRDVVGLMYQRGWIDGAQYKAGNIFLGLLELAEEARSTTCDPSREVVDGASSRYISPEITESRERAISKLRRVARELGPDRYRWAGRIIRDNLTIAQLATEERIGRNRAARQFKAILIDLVDILNVMV